MSNVLGPKTYDLYEGCEVFPSKKMVKAKTSMVGDPRMSGFPPPPLYYVIRKVSRKVTE
ncbi:MAG: hypothetical protein QXX41_07590 [Nitrososphaerota archaeon]